MPQLAVVHTPRGSEPGAIRLPQPRAERLKPRRRAAAAAVAQPELDDAHAAAHAPLFIRLAVAIRGVARRANVAQLDRLVCRAKVVGMVVASERRHGTDLTKRGEDGRVWPIGIDALAPSLPRRRVRRLHRAGRLDVSVSGM